MPYLGQIKRIVPKILSSFLIIFIFFVSLCFAEKIKSCIECHPLGKFKGKFIHEPLQKINCFICHKAHVSKYPKLLKNKVPELCYSCHEKILSKEKEAEIVHQPFKKGECLKCHNAHKGDVFLLKKSLQKVCFKCHQIGANFKFPHKPFNQGKCNICHFPHFSNFQNLLKTKNICLNCHPLQKISKTHPYLKEGHNCQSCHISHGGNNRSLLKEIAHKPYKDKACNKCHAENVKGNDMCFQCHEKIKKEFVCVYNHYMPSPKDKPFCINCHSPHLSNEKHLLKAKINIVCISCHREVPFQRAESLYVHKDLNNCLTCHKGHGSDVRGILKEKDMKLCGSCHERHTKFTHPIGEKVRDPRNGQPTSCMTCHDPMGTKYKFLLRLSGEKTLCIECHKGY